MNENTLPIGCVFIAISLDGYIATKDSCLIQLKYSF